MASLHRLHLESPDLGSLTWHLRAACVDTTRVSTLRQTYEMRNDASDYVVEMGCGQEAKKRKGSSAGCHDELLYEPSSEHILGSDHLEAGQTGRGSCSAKCQSSGWQ